VFSAALPAILAVTASESISLLGSKEGEEQLSLLEENAHTFRTILDKSEHIETTSDYNSPIIHYRLTEPTISANNLKTLQDQERALQEIVDEVSQRRHPNPPSPFQRLILGERPWRVDCTVTSDCCAGSVCVTTRFTDMCIVRSHKERYRESGDGD